MIKNLAVALNAGTPTQRNAITNYLVTKGWAYWHWIDDFWIVQVPNQYTAKLLYDELEPLHDLSTATILTFHFDGTVQYWGRAPKAAWDWLDHIGTAG